MSKPTGMILPAQSNQVIPWLSGNYYSLLASTQFQSNTNSTFAVTADRIHAVPLLIPQGEAIDTIAVNITTPAAAGKLYRLGLLTMGADGRPGDLIQGGASAAADVGGNKTLSLTTPQGPGWCYLAFWSDGAPVTYAVAVGYIAVPFGEATIAAFTRNVGFYHSLAFGAWPASFGSVDGSIGTTAPLLVGRAV